MLTFPPRAACRCCTLVCLLLSTLCVLSTHAQDDDSLQGESLLLEDFSSPTEAAPDPGPWVPSLRSIGGNALDVFGAPLRMDADRLQTLAGATGVVVGIVAGLDQPAYDRVPASTGTNVAAVSTPLSAPGRFYDHLGPDRVALSAVGAFALSGIALQDRRMTRTSVRIAEAVLLTKVTTGALKGLFGRARPYTGDGRFGGDLARFGSGHSLRSMPSGHTSRAFALASVIAHEYDTWWVQIPAYGVATSVGIQRVRSGNHWLSDVVVGGAIGYLIGQTVVGPPSSRGNAVSYTPIVSTRSIGLRLQF